LRCKTFEGFIDFAKTTNARRIANFATAQFLFDKSANLFRDGAFSALRYFPAGKTFGKAETITKRTRIARRFRSYRFAHVVNRVNLIGSGVINDRAIKRNMLENNFGIVIIGFAV